MDTNNALLYACLYSPYGVPYGATGTLQTVFGFTGEPTEGTGLVDLRARHLNPALGVFPNLDPVEGDMQWAMSLNRYGYVAGNVVNEIDPSGQVLREPLDVCGTPQGQVCPNARNLVPAVDYSARTYVDTTYARYALRGDFGQLCDSPFGASAAKQLCASISYLSALIDTAARLAGARGNIHAARNLKHWLDRRGTPLDNYEVEQMINDLSKWKMDISTHLGTSIVAAVQGSPFAENGTCAIFKNNSATGTTPLYAGGKTTWRRVGIGHDPEAEARGRPFRHTEVDVYTHGIGIHFDKALGPIKEPKDILSIFGFVPAGAPYTQAEFDWYLAMNAFDYSIAESIVWNKQSGSAEVCYRVDVADEYVWYRALGGLDAIMADLEEVGLGRGYEIRGRSKTRCFHITIPYSKREGLARIWFQGFLPEEE